MQNTLPHASFELCVRQSFGDEILRCAVVSKVQDVCAGIKSIMRTYMETVEVC